MNTKEYAKFKNITIDKARVDIRNGKVENSCWDIKSKTWLVLENQNYPTYEELAKIKHKYLVNEDVITNETAISFYLLGAFMSDGNIKALGEYYKYVSISSKDKDWLDSIKNELAPTKPLEKKKNSNCYVLQLSSWIIADWLISYGCTPNKSLTIKMEKEISVKYFGDFIRGLVDGDGSITFLDEKTKSTFKSIYKRRAITIYSGSLIFLEQIKDILKNKFSIESGIHANKSKGHFIGKHWANDSISYVLKIKRNSVLDLINLMYYSDNLLCLERKQKIAQQIINFCCGGYQNDTPPQ